MTNLEDYLVTVTEPRDEVITYKGRAVATMSREELIEVIGTLYRTTLQVAHEQGRRAIGITMERADCRTAVRRLRQEPLFA